MKRAIVVHGREHFISRYNNLTCIAAPIFGPDGELTGILDASSDCMSRQAHTQALVYQFKLNDNFIKKAESFDL